MPNLGTLGWAYVSGSTIVITGAIDQRVTFFSGSTAISGSDKFKYDYINSKITATGSIATKGFMSANAYMNPATMDASITIPANHNSVLVGPVTVDSGVDFIIAVSANAKII